MAGQWQGSGSLGNEGPKKDVFGCPACLPACFCCRYGQPHRHKPLFSPSACWPLACAFPPPSQMASSGRWVQMACRAFLRATGRRWSTSSPHSSTSLQRHWARPCLHAVGGGGEARGQEDTGKERPPSLLGWHATCLSLYDQSFASTGRASHAVLCFAFMYISTNSPSSTRIGKASL